jgi:hypothetical protein
MEITRRRNVGGASKIEIEKSPPTFAEGDFLNICE